MFQQRYRLMLLVAAVLGGIQQAAPQPAVRQFPEGFPAQTPQLGISQQRGIVQQQQAQASPQQVQPAPVPTVEDWLRLLVPPQPEPGPFGAYDDRGGRGRRSRVVPQNAAPPPARVPTQEEVASLSPAQQRSLLRSGLQRLVDQLASMRVGAGWHDFLQLERLGAALWKEGEAVPDATTRASLVAAAAQFDAVAQNGDYRIISGLPGFATVHVALGEYAMDPVQQDKRRVRRSAAELQQALQQAGIDDSWQKYLQVDEIVRLAQSESEVTDAEEELLREIIERYNDVSQNDKYNKVARLYGFDPVRRNLQEMAEEVKRLKQPVSVDPAAQAREALQSVVLDLQTLKRACQEESQLTKTLAEQPSGTSEAAANQELLKAIKERHDQAMADALERLHKLIKATLAKEEEEYVLMQFSDVEEPIEVMLLQFSDVEQEEEEYVLFQFADIEAARASQQSNGQDSEQTSERSGEPPPCHTTGRRSLSDVIAIVAAESELPEGLTTEQSGLLGDLLGELQAEQPEQAQQRWQQLVTAAVQSESDVDISAVARHVIRESYAEELAELKQTADRARHYNRTKALLREHLASLREAAGRLDSEASVQLETLTGLPIFRPGRADYTIWQRQKLDAAQLQTEIEKVQQQLETLGADRQLADIDLQQASQKLQQLLQMMSQASKMLHDTQMEIIRQLGS